MKINGFFGIIYKIVNVVYEKQVMKIQFSLVKTYKLT